MTSGRRVLRNGLAVTVVSLVVVGCGTDPAGLGRSGNPVAPTTMTVAPSTTGPTATVAPSTTGVVDVSGTELTAGLVPFTECDELLRHLRTEATERVGPYGLGGGWFGGPVVMLSLIHI